jgi:AraC-like DNA-binding protein
MIFSTNVPTVHWPLSTLARVTTAGRFPLDDQHFSHGYGGPGTPIHALHIYGYSGTIRIGNREFNLSPGDLTLSPAGVTTRYHLPRPGHHYCLHFEAVKARKSPQSVGLPVHMNLGPWRELAEQKLMWIARLHAMSQQDRTAGHAASAALQELLLWLALIPMQSVGGRQPRVDLALEAAVDYIEQNLGRTLSVPQLARRVQLSQNYLARKFRDRFGMTIPRYILTRRIGYARSLLITTSLPINRIAARAGLDDPQYFNKQFRRLTGMSPTAARAAGA